MTEFLFDIAVPNKPTVGQTDFKEYYPTLSHGMAWSNLKPYVRQAMTLNILPFINDEIIALCTANISDDTPDPVINILTDKIKQALALYAIHQGFPELLSHISDGGATTPAQEGAATVTQWAFKTQRWNTILKAERFLDDAILYLIKNKDTFEEWDDTKYSSTWFDSSAHLEKYISVNGFRGFLSLRRFFDTAAINLEQELGCATYADLLDNIADEDYKAVINYARQFIAHKSLELAMPSLITYVEGNTITFLSTADGSTDGFGVYAKPNTESISMLINSARAIAASSIGTIYNLMQHDQTTFSVFTVEHSSEPSSTVIHSDDHIGGIML